jgi:hypothetical protein
VTVTPSVSAPGQVVEITVARHGMEPLIDELNAAAILTCGDAREPIRLWPTAQPGSFTGTATAPADGTCAIEASIEGRSAAHGVARLVVSPGLAPMPGRRASLADVMAAHGAAVRRVGEEEELVARVRQLLPDTRAPQETRPMRSPWWLLPFAASLSGEWWLRRRAGRR